MERQGHGYHVFDVAGVVDGNSVDQLRGQVFFHVLAVFGGQDDGLDADAARGNGSAGAGENHGYVVRLLSAANPFRHGIGNGLTDARKRLLAMFLKQRDQALLAEFA